MDWLANQVVKALQETKMDKSWIEDKARELEEMSRMDVLRWMPSKLDAVNLAAVCERLEISVADMKATQRVLQKI